MLKRHQCIRGSVPKFEVLVQSLSGAQLKYVDRFDEQFSKAAVHVAIRELKKRSAPCSQWFSLKNGTQDGPMNRMELEECIESGSLAGEDMVWKEGAPSWEKISDMQRLTETLFYDQEIQQKEPPLPQERQSTESKSGSTHIAGGILELLKFPFWLVAIFVIPFSSMSASIGVLLSTVLGFTLFLSIIPVGVGLLMSKKWAYGMKIGTGVLIICWFATRVMLESGSKFWILFIIVEVLILGLILSAKDNFK
jgi:hypothetical protein